MKVIFFVIILLLGFFLRLNQLGNIPVGFHRDEAYLGYNAYSILQTGKDITGHFLPLNLESFLFSPAGYSYASIPFIAFFGLNEFSVRLASALFGGSTIILVYFLVKKLFNKYAYREQLALISAFSLSISPWHTNLSRAATENVLVVFFITLGTLLYLHWIDRHKTILLLASFASFGITFTIYQAPRAYLPLFFPLLLFILFYKTPYIKKMLLPLLLYIAIIIVPLAVILTSQNLSQRIRMLSIFQHPGTQLILNEQIREDGATANTLVTRLFHNKAINYSSTFLQNYFKHFSYDFIFTDSGLPDRYRIAQMGLLYLIDFPLLIFGLIRLFKKEKRSAFFLSGWVLLGPIGSALTFDDIPNLQRTLIVFPALSIITAFGLLEFWQTLSRVKFAFVIKIFLPIVIFYSFLFYMHQYYIHQIAHRPWYRQEGYKQMVARVNELLPEYKKAVITDSESAPEIFFLFYSLYDPQKIQLISQKTGWKTTSIKFGKYTFSPSECPLHTDTYLNPLTRQEEIFVRGEKNILYVNNGRCKNPEKYIKTISEIKRPDGTTAFKISEMK